MYNNIYGYTEQHDPELMLMVEEHEFYQDMAEYLEGIQDVPEEVLLQ